MSFFLSTISLLDLYLYVSPTSPSLSLSFSLAICSYTLSLNAHYPWLSTLCVSFDLVLLPDKHLSDGVPVVIFYYLLSHQNYFSFGLHWRFK